MKSILALFGILLTISVSHAGCRAFEQSPDYLESVGQNDSFAIQAEERTVSFRGAQPLASFKDGKVYFYNEGLSRSYDMQSFGSFEKDSLLIDQDQIIGRIEDNKFVDGSSNTYLWFDENCSIAESSAIAITWFWHIIIFPYDA